MVRAEVGKKHKMGQLTVPDSAKKARTGSGQAPAIVPADTGPIPESQADGQSSGVLLPAPPPGFIPPAGGLPRPAAPTALAPETAGMKAEPVLPQHAGNMSSRGSQPVPLPPGTRPQHRWAETAASDGQRTVQGPPQASAPSPVQPGILPHSSVSAAKHHAQQSHSGSFMAGLRADLGATMPMRERLPVPQQLPASLAALPAYPKPAVADLPVYCRPALPLQTQQQAQMRFLPPPQLPGYRRSSIGALPPGAVFMPGVSGAPQSLVPRRRVVASQQQFEAQHVKPVPLTYQAAAPQPQHAQQAANTAPSGALTGSGPPKSNQVRLPGSHAQVAAIRDADGFSPRFQQSSVKMCQQWARTCEVAERTQDG